MPSPTYYITEADVRAAGLTDTVRFTTAAINASIALWQAFIERVCRQWFESRSLTIKCDGNGGETLFLGVPVITVTSLKINNSASALDSSSYIVYNGRTWPDDRKNPRISLRQSSDVRDIYSNPLSLGRFIFRKGSQNQEIVGTFGYVEADGTSCPELIKRALLKLVVGKLTNPIYPEGTPGLDLTPPPILGLVQSESTDGHSISYGQMSFGGRRFDFQGTVLDPEVLEILRMFKAPIGVATPVGWVGN